MQLGAPFDVQSYGHFLSYERCVIPGRIIDSTPDVQKNFFVVVSLLLKRQAGSSPLKLAGISLRLAWVSHSLLAPKKLEGTDID